MSSPDPAAPTRAPAPTEFTLRKGATIGRYLVLGALGRGGIAFDQCAKEPAICLRRYGGGALRQD